MLHCCETMRRHAEHECGQHPERFDCPDCLIDYSPQRRAYGIIVHDGGRSVVTIRFCPWCGTRLPGTPRDEPAGGADADAADEGAA